MPVVLQAVARLVALKRLGVLLFVLLATLCATHTASAHERPQTKTRVRNFELAEHHSHGLSIAAKQRNASGKSRCWCPNSHQIYSYRWRDPSGRDAEEWFLRNAGTLQNGALAVSAAAATLATGGLAGELLGFGTLESTLSALGLGATSGAAAVVNSGAAATAAAVAAKAAESEAGECAAAAEGVETLSASSIRFSQSSVNGVGEITESMAANGWKGAPIDVVQMGDNLITVDNTRLLAAHMTDTPVQAIIRGAGEALPESMVGRFGNATTWGEAVTNRIAGQNAAYRSLFPNGSWAVGVGAP